MREKKTNRNRNKSDKERVIDNREKRDIRKRKKR